MIHRAREATGRKRKRNLEQHQEQRQSDRERKSKRQRDERGNEGRWEMVLGKRDKSRVQ